MHPTLELQFGSQPENVRPESDALNGSPNRDFGALSVHLASEVKSPSTKPI